MSPRHVELLYVEGCPNLQPTLDLIERTRRDLAVAVELELVAVPDRATARRLRFPGSPTVRVDGRDIDPTPPGAYTLGCRIYRTDRGLSGRPDRRRLEAVLLGGSSGQGAAAQK